MTRKQKLQAFFDSKQDDLKYIQTYEENLDFFNELLRTGRAEELEFVLPIKLLKYADPLNMTGNYTRALKVLDEVGQDLKKLKGLSKWCGTYEDSLTFLKGVCLSRLKRYRESNVEFSTLLKKKKGNDGYINWYKANKKRIVDKYCMPIMFIALAGYLCLFALEFTPLKVNISWLQTSLLTISMLSLVLSYFLKVWIDRTSPRPTKNQRP